MQSQNLKITLVWLFLCAITVASVLLSQSDLVIEVGVVVLSIAFAKVYLVMHYFMELDHAPKPWRLAFAGWTIAALLILAGLSLLG